MFVVYQESFPLQQTGRTTHRTARQQVGKMLGQTVERMTYHQVGKMLYRAAARRTHPEGGWTKWLAVGLLRGRSSAEGSQELRRTSR